MQTLFIRKIFDLFRKQIALIILLFLISNALMAQQSRRKFQADYDAKNMRFGYLIGIFQSNFHINTNGFLIQQKTSSITSKPLMGFKLGGLVNFAINEYWDFRILPTVSLPRRNISIVDSLGKKTDYTQGDKAWFEIPVMLKYKSERRGNERMYIFAGLRYGAETNTALKLGGKKQASSGQIPLKGHDFSIEYGIGLELFREYFKFAPELHFSHGIKNLVDPLNSKDLRITDKITTHSVTLYFIFE